MKLLLWIFLIVILHCLYAVLRFAILRIKFYFRLKSFAKGQKLQLKFVSWTFFVPSNRIGTALYLETPQTIYNIQLFGLVRKNCAVHFWNKSEYSVEKYIPRMSLVSEPPLGKSSAKHRYIGTWKDHTVDSKKNISVLLYTPANSPIKITQTMVNHIVNLLAGDRIEDVLFADVDYLFRRIANEVTIAGASGVDN